MKGLLLKDFYMGIKYCRSFIAVVFIFLAISCLGDNNLFFLFYPCMISSLIPVTLISYDEREKWNLYSATLPYSKAQIVSSKYLIGLFVEIVVFSITAVTLAVRMMSAASFVMEEYLTLLSALFVLTCIGPSLVLPFIFKFGAEKGRIAYYIVIGILCAGGTLIAGIGFQFPPARDTRWVLALICVAAAAVYILSWLLSIAFYKKREL